jgi:hypothetical protein
MVFRFLSPAVGSEERGPLFIILLEPANRRVRNEAQILVLFHIGKQGIVRTLEPYRLAADRGGIDPAFAMRVDVFEAVRFHLAFILEPLNVVDAGPLRESRRA